jgi:hypothetical protein
VIYLRKGRAFVDRLAAVAARAHPKQMIEIGILNGGSTIYWQKSRQAHKFIGCSGPMIGIFLRMSIACVCNV